MENFVYDRALGYIACPQLLDVDADIPIDVAMFLSFLHCLLSQRAALAALDPWSKRRQ